MLVPVLGAGAGRRELARRRSALAPASDSEVITPAAPDSEGWQTAACSSEGRPTAVSDSEVPAVMGPHELMHATSYGVVACVFFVY